MLYGGGDGGGKSEGKLLNEESTVDIPLREVKDKKKTYLESRHFNSRLKVLEGN